MTRGIAAKSNIAAQARSCSQSVHDVPCGRCFLDFVPVQKENMPEWLSTVAPGLDVTVQSIAFRMVAAAILGLIVACVYQASHRKQLAESFAFIVTMVLLTILVAMTTLVIDNNVARAFSLVGALSIVRFRTVVDDTRDTAFVIFAVVVGMAVGAGTIPVYVIGVPVVAVTSIGLSLFGRGLKAPNPDRRLEIRVEGGIDCEILLAETFRQQASSHRLVAVSTAKQGAALDLVYQVRLNRPESSLQFVRTLAQLDGVQSVELK